MDLEAFRARPVEEHQKVVNAMGQAITDAETTVLEAMDEIASFLPKALHEFHDNTPFHQTIIPFGEAQEAIGLLGAAYRKLAEVHRQLDSLRRGPKYPDGHAHAGKTIMPPVAIPLDGGGCKPHC